MLCSSTVFGSVGFSFNHFLHPASGLPSKQALANNRGNWHFLWLTWDRSHNHEHSNRRKCITVIALSCLLLSFLSVKGSEIRQPDSRRTWSKVIYNLLECTFSTKSGFFLNTLRVLVSIIASTVRITAFTVVIYRSAVKWGGEARWRK